MARLLNPVVLVFQHDFLYIPRPWNCIIGGALSFGQSQVLGDVYRAPQAATPKSLS